MEEEKLSRYIEIEGEEAKIENTPTQIVKIHKHPVRHMKVFDSHTFKTK
jgi:hypothetical protein